ncbi:MAG: helix-turn-helix domain-containing protein [Gammaproteobacteria bacterium]|nr:helix-turn-helix domain-containing protein [Gammaproteobacteria bacterium]
MSQARTTAVWPQVAALLPDWVGDADALAARLEVDRAELEHICTVAKQQSATHLLQTAKVARAKALLHAAQASLSAIAADCGFSSKAAMDRCLTANVGVDSAGWRASRGAKQLTARLPKRFRRDETLNYLGRDKHSTSVRRGGNDTFAIAWLHAGRALTMQLSFHHHDVAISLQGVRGRVPDGAAPAALELVARLLGTHSPAADFEQRAAVEPLVHRLTRGRRGLRISLTHTAFDAIVWSIIGQQVSLPFAYQMLRSASELCGAPAPGGLKTMPVPATLAELAPDRLMAFKFSRAKAQYLTAAARAVSEGQLRIPATIEDTAEEVYTALISQRGLGPWSVNYIMMRGLGFADCVPLGDAGLRRALSAFLDSGEAPDSQRMAAVMEPFKPHRSLATFHLWRWLDLPNTVQLTA